MAPPSHHIDAGSRRLAILICTVILTVTGLTIIAAACWLLVPSIDKTPAFNARFTVLPGFLYAGQPAKSAAFEACCAAAPFLLVLSFLSARRATDSLPAAVVRRFIPAALALHLLAWAACLFPLFYCPHPPLWIAPQWLLVPREFPPPVPSWEWIASLLAGSGLVLFFTAQRAGRQARRRVMVPVILLWFFLAPTRFFAPSEITDQLHFTYHLNSVLDALSQATDGHHLLVDFPHIYGGYVEILAPILRLFPRTIGAPLLALALPGVLGVLCLLLTARLVIRPPVVLLLACCALLSFSYLVSVPDPNYGYATARSVFPAVGLFLAALYFGRPGPGRYLLTSLVAALAPIWNLDTGLVLWGSWLLTLLAADLSGQRWPRLASHLANQVALFLGAWGSFFVYLRLASGHWPDLHLLFYFQSMVVQSGYFCVALLVPNAWMSLVLLYVTGLTVAFLAHLRGQIDPETRFILMLSLLGIGTFSYYMGRSAEPNLISVCCPGVILLGILAGRANLAIRRGLLPAVTRWFLLPWAAMTLWWVILLFTQLPFLLARGPQLVRDWRDAAITPFEARAATIIRWIHPHDPSVFFLSDHSGFYYYLTQTTRPLPIPGTVELLRTRDMEVLLNAIRRRQIARLIVDPNFYAIDMYRPDVYQAVAAGIAQNYRPLQISSAGDLILYVPRAGPGSP